MPLRPQKVIFDQVVKSIGDLILHGSESNMMELVQNVQGEVLVKAFIFSYYVRKTLIFLITAVTSRLIFPLRLFQQIRGLKVLTIQRNLRDDKQRIVSYSFSS